MIRSAPTRVKTPVMKVNPAAIAIAATVNPSTFSGSVMFGTKSCNWVAA